jgi:hypothetical protein
MLRFFLKKRLELAGSVEGVPMHYRCAFHGEGRLCHEDRLPVALILFGKQNLRTLLKRAKGIN